MKLIPNNKQAFYVAVVLAMGIVLAALILLTQGGTRQPQQEQNGSESGMGGSKSTP